MFSGKPKGDGEIAALNKKRAEADAEREEQQSAIDAAERRARLARQGASGGRGLLRFGALTGVDGPQSGRRTLG